MPDAVVVSTCQEAWTPASDDASGKEGGRVNLGDWLRAMLALFLWFMAIWNFIQIFAEILRPGEHDWVKLRAHVEGSAASP
jgi:hypothetical protein